MANDPRIFKATYSNVPVYEMMCKNVPVMRRRSDAYLNATQILKVAEFDKPQRTRILEKEVQIGLHEKVQGGYGKYQGTWVPFERGVALAQQYNVAHLLQPIFDFVEGDKSPPLAPKHTTMASGKPRKPREPRHKRLKYEENGSEMDSQSQYSDMHDYDYMLTAEQAETRSPSPFVLHMDDSDGLHERLSQSIHDHHRTQYVKVHRRDPVGSDEEYESHNMTYAQKLLQHFVSGNPTVPPLLSRPPWDLEVNVIIDDEGHTSLHWASAMGQMDTVQVLINLNADIYRVNYKGQTALMRSVLFTNNFDKKTFYQLLNLLQKTIFNIDKKDQTVFHHVASTASWKGKVHASRYYMECLIDKLAHNRSELISILNVQDVYGDTALTIAARIGNKKLVRLLTEAGASPEIANEEGMTAQAYLDEADRNSRLSRDLLSSSGISNNLTSGHATRARLRQRIESILKQIGTKDGHVPVMSQAFDGFVDSYERDLMQKESSIKEKRKELDALKKRFNETKRLLEQIRYDQAKFNELEIEGQALQKELRCLMYHTQKERLTQLVEAHSAKGAEMDTDMGVSHQLESNGNNNDASSTKPDSSTETNTTGEDEKDGQKQLAELRETLKELQSNRHTLVDEIIRLKCEPPGKRYQEYKRLISMCCNVQYENVDVMLLPLLASFDEADTTET